MRLVVFSHNSFCSSNVRTFTNFSVDFLKFLCFYEFYKAFVYSTENFGKHSDEIFFHGFSKAEFWVSDSHRIPRALANQAF